VSDVERLARGGDLGDHVGRMAALAPYSPALYLPGSIGRFRQYPRQVRARIPGTGYRVRQFVWAPQELNLDGGGKFADGAGGRYGRVPLLGIGGNYRGVGDLTPADVASVASVTARLITNPDETMRTQGPALVNALDRHLVSPLVDRAMHDAQPYLLRYFGPPMAVLYLLTGLSTYYSYLVLKAKGPKLSANRRRRRRR